MSLLNSFIKQFLTFLGELEESYPEVKEIRKGIDLVENFRKINPRLIHELFYKYVYIPFYDDIKNKDMKLIQKKVTEEYSNHSEFPMFMNIFLTNQSTMSDNNKEAVWKYLFVLCTLSKKIEEGKGV